MNPKFRIATICISSFCAGATVSLFTLPLWVTVLINASREGTRTDWLGFAGGILGNIITAIVAVFAVYFAWLGVRRQLRTGVIIREEERIERLLPGLREMAGGLEQLFPKPLNKGSLALIGLTPLRGDHSGVNEIQIRRWFPQADPSTQQDLLVILQQFEEAAAMMASSEKSQSKMIGLHALMFFNAQERLTAFKQSIIDRVRIYEKRQSDIRREIERYFDNVT